MSLLASDSAARSQICLLKFEFEHLTLQTSWSTTAVSGSSSEGTGNTACRTSAWNVRKDFSACTEILLQLWELRMDAKGLQEEGPQINSETLGKEQSQLPEIPQELSFSLVWFNRQPDTVLVINDVSFPIN